ncbi:hypothetical protein MMC22_002910 [Lobaria immixta]|nr:hypothetical protein [Lobaria immixta]
MSSYPSGDSESPPSQEIEQSYSYDIKYGTDDPDVTRPQDDDPTGSDAKSPPSQEIEQSYSYDITYKGDDPDVSRPQDDDPTSSDAKSPPSQETQQSSDTTTGGTDDLVLATTYSDAESSFSSSGVEALPSERARTAPEKTSKDF